MHHSLSPTPRTPRTTRTPTRRNAKLVGSPKAQTKTTAKSRSPKRSPARTTSPASSSTGPQPPPATARPNLPEASQTPIGLQPPFGNPQPAQEIESSASGTEIATDKEMADDDDPVEEGSLEPEQAGSPENLAGHEEAQTFFQKQRMELEMKKKEMVKEQQEFDLKQRGWLAKDLGKETVDEILGPPPPPPEDDDEGKAMNVDEQLGTPGKRKRELGEVSPPGLKTAQPFPFPMHPSQKQQQQQPLSQPPLPASPPPTVRTAHPLTTEEQARARAGSRGLSMLTSENVLRKMLTKKYGKAAAAFPAGPEDGLAAAAAAAAAATALAAPPPEAAVAAAAATADGTLTPTQVFEGYPAGYPEEDGQLPSAQGDVTPEAGDDMDDSDPAWSAAAAAAATPTRSATASSTPLTPAAAAAAAAAAATMAALTAVSGAASAGLGPAVGSADQPLHPKLLEVSHGVQAQLYAHSESIKEINGKGPAAGSPKAGHDEVRDMFRQLLAGQNDQKAKTMKLASYVEKGLHCVRQEVALKTDNLNDKVNQMQADFDIKFTQLEKKYASRPPPLGCRSPAAAASADRGCLGSDEVGGSTTKVTNYPDGLKVVVGGWTKPQLKRVLEAKMRHFTEMASVTVTDIIITYKRAQVCYVVFLTNAEMMKFPTFLRTTKPNTDIENDMAPLWGKVSQPLEQRKKTVHLRCGARAVFTVLETYKSSPPADFTIDYLFVGDNIVCPALQGDLMRSENAWKKTMPTEAKERFNEVKTAAYEFIFNLVG